MNNEGKKWKIHFLFAAELEQARHFDKYILTLAAGAFGLSLLFISQIDLQPETICLLVAAWASFSGSILLTLISFLLSLEGCFRQRKSLELNEKEIKNVLPGWTKWFNWLSMLLFIVGVIFLIIFSKLNLLS